MTFTNQREILKVSKKNYIKMVIAALFVIYSNQNSVELV